MGSPTQVERIFPSAVNTDKEIWDGTGDELGDRLTVKLKELKFV
jgi:electron transfer flavoprotein beta subunit